MYDVSHKLVHKDLSVGLPDFNRYITKEKRKEKLGMGASPNPYDYEQIKLGFHSCNPFKGGTVPFKMQMGRDNVYERKHGLPKHTKE